MNATANVATLVTADTMLVGNRLFCLIPRSGLRLADTRDHRSAAPVTKPTLDKYARDFALFGSWVIAKSSTEAIVPTDPALLGTYIDDLLRQGLSQRRVLSRIAAVQFANKILGHKLCLEEYSIRLGLRGLYRSMGVDGKERTTLSHEEITAIFERLGPPKALSDYRDRALVALAYASALRRSSIVQLRVSDITIKCDSVNGNRYLELFVQTSETSGIGNGRHIKITESPAHHPLCALGAIEAWIERSGIADEPNSPLFRSFTPRGYKIKARGIGGRDLALTIKRMAKATGRDQSRISAHSLRRGFAISASEKRLSSSVVVKCGGWQPEAMVARYMRIETASTNFQT